MRVERRKHSRKKPEGLVYLDLGPSNGGMVRDVSLGGIGFRAVSPMRAGQRVTFAFAFDGATRLEGECELVWTDDDGKTAGLRFTEVSPELREAVRKRIAGESQCEESIVETPAAAATPIATMEEIRREIRQPSGAARRAARMLAEPAPAETVEPEPKEQAPPPAMVMPRVAEPTGELQQEARPAAKPEIEPATKPEVTREVRPVETAVIIPTAPLWPVGAHLSYEAMELRDEEMPSARRRGRVTLSPAVATMLLLTLLAVGYVYHRAVGESLIWLGQRIVGEETSATQVTAPSEAKPPAAAATPAETPTPARTEPELERVVGTAKPSAPPPAAMSPQVGNATSVHEAPAPAPAVQSAKNEGNGQTEFLQALQILRGKNRGELAEAVRLLWVAVEKGNSSAEVALADLYRRGEGMPQNCDQTRILLTAAVKKGNNEARNRLAQLDQQGCP